jgi:tetratricopeptide (TPR) repeat protein
VLVLVDHAHPERLGDLVRALLPTHPELEVHSDARKLVGVKPGSTVVLVPRAEDADWLNINRPLFALNGLRVVLFATREVSVALARGAVDFFDWISHRLECPPSPAPFAVAGLRQALAIRAPGIVWKGGDLVAAFRATRPRRRLRTISAARPYEELVAEARAVRGDWLAWTDIDGEFRLRRVRWALAEARCRTRTTLVEPAVPSPGWWEVHGRVSEFRVAQERLERSGASHAGRLAALTDLEPEAIELLGALLDRGFLEQSLEAEMLRGADPGAAIGRLAAAHGLVSEEEVVRGRVSPPALRALSERSKEFHRLQEVEVDAVVQRLAQGTRLEPEDVAWWSASTRTLAIDASSDGLGRRGEVAEVVLRHEARRGSTWEGLASIALLAGDFQVAHLWAQRAADLEPQRWMGFAQVLIRQGRWAEAESILRQRLHLTRDSSRQREVVLHELAWALEEQGRYAEAEEVLRQALSVEENALGKAHPSYAASLHNLGRVLDTQGRYAEAEELLRQALAIKERALGKAHPHYAASLCNLAWVLNEQGRYAEAEELMRQTLAIDEKALGKAHPHYADSLQNLAWLLTKRGRYAEAEELMRQALAVEEKALGTTHPNYATSLHGLARVLGGQGRYVEAEDLVRQGLAIQESVFGAAHPKLCAALTLLGFTLTKQNRPEEGELFLQRSVEIALASWGLHHLVTAQALHRLALAQGALKKTEGVATARQAIEAFLKSLGPEHPLTKEALPELKLILEGSRPS